MPQEISQIVSAISGLGFTGLMIVLAVPRLKRMVFGNGTKEITTNHLPHLEQKMDDIIKILNEQSIRDAERHGEIIGKLGGV